MWQVDESVTGSVNFAPQGGDPQERIPPRLPRLRRGHGS